MNDRIKALQNAPASRIPQTDLTSVRAINAAVQRVSHYGVYCSYEGVKYRVYKARSRWGRLEVRLHNAVWVTAERVYQEG